MRWFRALMPREERFFDLFARHSDVVVAGAKGCGICWKAAMPFRATTRP